MGWDISGSLEVSHGKGFIKLMDLFFLAREYSLFGDIFGVKGRGKEHALAFNRGMPDEAALETINKYRLAVLDNKTTCYLTWILQSELSNFVQEIERNNWLDSDGLGIDWSWKFLFDSMSALADVYGGSNVRLVVWFDF